MVLALIEALGVTKGLREAIPFLEGIVTRNPELSARAVIEAAREAGLRFSDGPAFNIISQLKSNLDAKELFGLTDLDELPDLHAFGLSDSPMTRNYQFMVSIRGYNPLTGEREERFISIMSDSILSPAQVIETALALPKDSPGSQWLSNATVTVESAKKSPYVR